MIAIRVLLAEDHPWMQEIIASLLAAPFQLVEIVSRGDQILAAVGRLNPEVILLDVSLPGRGGLQVLPELRKQFPSIAVVVLSTHNEPVYRTEAVERGADAFIDKSKAPCALLPAIDAALQARQTVSQATRRTG